MPEPSSRSSKNRKRPPWGDRLGGRPVRPLVDRGWFVASGAEQVIRIVAVVDTAEELRRRMEQLKDHYNASDWYELAVILASQRDVALTVTPLETCEKAVGKPQWQGHHGVGLVRVVKLLRSQGFTTWPAIADELRSGDYPEVYKRFSAATLKARYKESRDFVQRLQPRARTRRERD